MIEVVKRVQYGSTFYYIKGTKLRHREDGPAIEWENGKKEWYRNGLRHRVDGPAVIYINGDKVWYMHGERHREDGPAIIYGDGRIFWYLNDTYFSKKEAWFQALAEEQQAKALYSEYFIGG